MGPRTFLRALASISRFSSPATSVRPSGCPGLPGVLCCELPDARDRVPGGDDGNDAQYDCYGCFEDLGAPHGVWENRELLELADLIENGQAREIEHDVCRKGDFVPARQRQLWIVDRNSKRAVSGERGEARWGAGGSMGCLEQKMGPNEVEVQYGHMT